MPDVAVDELESVEEVDDDLLSCWSPALPPSGHGPSSRIRLLPVLVRCFEADS